MRNHVRSVRYRQQKLHLESLERRQLLASNVGDDGWYIRESLSGGHETETLVVNGTSADDRFEIRLSGRNDTTVKVFRNNRQVFSDELSELSAIEINGNNGNDSLTVRGGPTNDAFVLQGTSLTINGLPVSSSSIESLQLDAGSGDDSIRVDSDLGVTSIAGGLGLDLLTGPDVPTDWTLRGLGTGTMGNTTLSGMETLQGGNFFNQFFVDTNGKLSGKILGGQGIDSLSYVHRTSAVQVNMSSTIVNSGSGTDIQGFESIDSVIGSQSSLDNFGGSADTGNVYFFNGAYTGQYITFLPTGVSQMGYVGFENYQGGTLGDTYFAPGSGDFANRIDGGSGRNRIDYSVRNEGVSIDLSAHIATGVGALMNINDASGSFFNDTIRGNEFDNGLIGWAGDDIIFGGDGSDDLVGFSGNDQLYGEGGNDLLIGGTGADELHGGSGDDILISSVSFWLAFEQGGGGSVDLGFASTILGAWNDPAKTYSERVAYLSQPFVEFVGPGVQVGLTDDTEVDLAFGEGGEDWFLLGANDIDDLQVGEIRNLIV